VTAGILLLTVAGLLVAGGVVGAVATVRGVRLLPERAGEATKLPRFRLSARHGIALGAGVLVLLLTGWPVAAISVVAGGLFIPKVLGGGKAAKDLIDKTEALADWTRRLADLIASGAASSTRDALVNSQGSVSNAISEQVDRLVHRIGPQGFEPSLRRFAAEVNDPSADKIAGVLILRERNGGPGLADVLTALAEDLDERARMVREVEAERAKPRANMRTIVVVTGVLIAGMVLFARTFLSGYSTPLGQTLLVLVALTFAYALRWMRRLSDPPAPPRVLVDITDRAPASSR
jgi:Flp pilus assembly protein TadB